VEKVVFWNGLFQSLIENLLMKFAEAALLRAGSFGPAKGKAGAQSDSTQGGSQEAVRSSVKERLARRGPAYRVMKLLTELMWLDLALFGKWRAGPYFLLARREERS
jgi:hypothetical protein